MFQRIAKLFGREAFGPQSLFVRIRNRPRIQITDRLYVLDVDFRIDEKQAQALQACLQPLRDKYGLDFMILEPGMRLRRFNDI